MATVDAFTKARTKAIEDAKVIGAHLSGDNLILECLDGSTINAGNVRGPAGTVVSTALATANSVMARDANAATAVQALTSGGLTGTIAGRYVGSTTSGSPNTGTWLAGDYVVSKDGHIYTCIVGGTPGSWVGGSNFNNHRSMTVDWQTSQMSHFAASTSDQWPWIHYYRDENGIVHLGGLANVGNPAPSAGATLFTLPPGFRPSVILRFVMPQAAGTYHCLIKPDGTVTADPAYSAFPVAAYISFDMIHFPAEDVASPAPAWIDLTPYLSAGWSAFGSGLSTPRAYVDASGDLYIQGNVKYSGAATYIGDILVLPTAIQPGGAGSQMFMQGSDLNGWGCRIDINPSGHINLANYMALGGLAGAGHISLDGIIIPAIGSPTKLVPFGYQGTWSAYAPPTWQAGYLYRNSIGRVFAGGLVKGGAPGSIGPQIGEDHRLAPTGKKLMLGACNATGTASGVARLDAYPDFALGGYSAGGLSNILYQNSGTNAFVSLNQMNWDSVLR